MGDVHRLILSKGVDGARAMAVTKAERHAIEAAAAILSEEERSSASMPRILSVRS
jgi:hypothetical protein